MLVNKHTGRQTDTLITILRCPSPKNFIYKRILFVIINASVTIINHIIKMTHTHIILYYFTNVYNATSFTASFFCSFSLSNFMSISSCHITNVQAY